MTSGISYNEQFEQTCNSYRQRSMSALQPYEVIPPRPKELRQLMAHILTVQTRYNTLTALPIEQLNFNPESMITDYYANLENQSKSKRNAIELRFQGEKDAALQAHEKAKVDAQRYNESLVAPIQEKHAELLSRKDELEKVFDHYDISPLDTDFSDNLTQAEFEVLIDESLAVCDKYTRESKFSAVTWINKLRGLNNPMMIIMLTLVGFMSLYIIAPILAIPVLVAFYMNIHNLYLNLDKLRMACSLMSQFDYKRFVPESEFRYVDDDIDVSYLDTQKEMELEEVEDYSDEKEEALRAMRADSVNLQRKCQELMQEAQQRKVSLVKKYEEELVKCKTLEQKLREEIVPFPCYFNPSSAMDWNFVVGIDKDKLDVKKKMEISNFIFDNKNTDDALSRMKLYLTNMLINAKAQTVQVDILDPKGLGEDFIDFLNIPSSSDFDEDLANFIEINKQDVTQTMKQVTGEIQTAVRKLGKKSVDAYNRDADEKGLIPQKYHVIILVSGHDKYLEEPDERSKGDTTNDHNKFLEVLKNSAAHGVIFMFMHNKNFDGCTFVSDYSIPDSNEYQYESSVGIEALKQWTLSVKQKPKALDYMKAFNDVFISRKDPKRGDTWWTYDTISGLLMCPGLADADPGRGLNEAIVISNPNVHALMGGMTGAGKSAAIDTFLMSMITMYPPSELSIIYIDFKAVEAEKYCRGRKGDGWNTPEEDKKLKKEEVYFERYSTLPQVSIISATTDGEYAQSIFNFLNAEYARRKKIISKDGSQKLEDVRKGILKRYNKEHGTKCTWYQMRQDWDWYKPNVLDEYGEMPRVIVVFDEFQVMFNDEIVDSKIQDKIRGQILNAAKLWRNGSMHLWFTSQSMKGTLSADVMSNFNLRMALRCKADVSQDLLGADCASKMPAKLGYIYTNESGGESGTKNQIWKVPYFPFGDEETGYASIMPQLEQLLVERREKPCLARLYDELAKTPFSELEKVLKEDENKDCHKFYLGLKAYYDTTDILSFTLDEDMKENIAIASISNVELLNLTACLMLNIAASADEHIILFNTRDKKALPILRPEDFMPKGYEAYMTNRTKQEEFIDIVEANVTKRQEKSLDDPSAKHRPIFVFLYGWEREEMPFKVSERFYQMLEMGPTVQVFFILCMRERGYFGMKTKGVCKHAICTFLDETSATSICDDMKPAKLKQYSDTESSIGIYFKEKASKKFKMYESAKYSPKEE